MYESKVNWIPFLPMALNYYFSTILKLIEFEGHSLIVHGRRIMLNKNRILMFIDIVEILRIMWCVFKELHIISTNTINSYIDLCLSIANGQNLELSPAANGLEEGDSWCEGLAPATILNRAHSSSFFSLSRSPSMIMRCLLEKCSSNVVVAATCSEERRQRSERVDSAGESIRE